MVKLGTLKGSSESGLSGMEPFGGQEAKSGNVTQAELSLVHSRFLENRSEHTAVLQAHCVNTLTSYATAHPIHRELRLSSYFRN
ncbi:hypothetical protein RO3G_06900 [Rhizopus delemar RA 99-880]|uniref:Uncharacterized protein n=1 Tax=Rhizopus delemar (strain RA 99-880 / ATCC MYA-4621 / FGSC 9543 / NRRL 43880) TaxID=246409 RepID=I1C165_RHIO9|nr:hypothetical protein RO3G_06900 [Rhizopus delemar RA 99-880]|eukprot:EIE82195.1 hypothetical protein RO3G_06900 [Rhizopus delemar RA 99-880]